MVVRCGGEAWWGLVGRCVGRCGQDGRWRGVVVRCGGEVRWGGGEVWWGGVVDRCGVGGVFGGAVRIGGEV